MKLTLTKCVEFEAAHYLYTPKLTREENLSSFHACSGIREGMNELYPHGHSYKLQVSISLPGSREIDSKTGFLLDFKKFKALIQKCIIDEFDHKLINKDISYFEQHPEITTTCENMLFYMWGNLEKELDKIEYTGIKLEKLRLYETSTSFAELRR